MTAARYCILSVAITTGIAFSQRKPNDRPAIVTVCETLGDVDRYAGAAVAVVGRLERTVSLIDHYEYLSQDRCKHPVVTHGHRWANQIQIWTDWEEGMPTPPRDKPKLDPAVVAAKLSLIRKTTTLGVHEEPRFKTEGQSITYSGTAQVPNEWAVVYGRIVRLPTLDEDCGADGCGGDDVPLFLITEPSQIHRLTAIGRPSLPRR